MQGREDVSDNDYDASSMYAALSYDVEDFYGLTINVDYYKGTGNDTSSGNTDNEAFGSEVTYGYFVDSFWYDYYLDAAANAGVFLTNLEAIGLGINFDPADKWHVITHYYMLSKEESNGSNDDLGDELGIKVSYKIDDVSNAYVTYSQFMPDDNYGEDDSTYLACQYAVNF
jgi:hypothetical protein